MNLEELLGAELAAQVTEKLGDKKLGVVNDGSWLPKSKLDEKIDEMNKLKEEIANRDKQLEQLTPLAQGNENLLKQIETLQQANTEAQANFEKSLLETKLNSALKMHYNGKVHDLDLTLNLLNKEAIKLDENGNIIEGLEEQDVTLKETKSFLFLPEQTTQVEADNSPKVKIQTSVGNPTTKDSSPYDPFAEIMAEYK